MPRDRVICLEWYSEGHIPEPKWHRDVWTELGEEEKRSLNIVLERYAVKSADVKEMNLTHLQQYEPSSN